MATNVVNVNQDSVAILNAIRAEASESYQSSVPEALADGSNMQDVGRAITEYRPNQNEFINILINRIGKTIFQNFSWTNPLKRFKRGTLAYGDTIQEIYVGLAKMYNYTVDGTEQTDIDENPFSRETPEVKQYFHQLNRQKVFKNTSFEHELSLAFINNMSVYNFVNGIIQSIFNTFEVWEWENVKGLWATAYNANELVKVEVPAPTDEVGMKAIVKKARELSTLFTMPSTEFNIAQVPMTTARGKQLVVMTAALESTLDVDVLASAFNMNKTEFMGNRIVIDHFPDGMENVHALILDEDWFMIWDKLLRMESIYNPAKMYWNYFLHYWGVYSYTILKNAVALVTTPATEDGEVTA